MSGSFDIQIQTVYSSGDRSAGASAPYVRFIGAVSLVFALLWLYVALFPVYGWIQKRVIAAELMIGSRAAAQGQEQSEGAASLNMLSQIMKNGADKPVNSADDSGGDAGPTPAAAVRHNVQFQAQFVPAAAEAWRAVTGGTGLWLAMAGMASLVGGARVTRRLGRWMFVLGLLALVGLVAYVWKQYGWWELLIPVWVIPATVGTIVAIVLAIGAMISRGGETLLRIGGYLVVFSAAVSVAGVYSAVRWGGMPPEGADLALYGKVFGVQSAYGWLLLISLFAARRARG